MTKRVASLVLAIAMFLQVLVPQTLIAREDVKAPSDNLVKVGLINGDSYDAKLMLELNRLNARNRKKGSIDPGTRLFGYFEDGQEPEDKDKQKYHGEVKAKLTVNGIDGGEFPWNNIFGTEEVHLRFTQINDESGAETGIERVLNINAAGEYLWTDGDDNPAELPLFNNKLEPLIYEVKLDEEVSDKVKLLTARITTTGDANTPTFEKPDAEGKIKYHLTLEIGLQQVASSKFVSEWRTTVAESDRPQIQGTMITSKKTAIFDLPKNDTDSVVIRANSVREGRKQDKIFVQFLYNTPSKVEVKTDTAGLTFDTAKTRVTYNNHTYKYEFTYDVLNGGKLTMTEIIPVTFDANGGKFDSITDQNAEQKIVKEVEYGKDLNEKVEIPRRDSHGFKGWGIKNTQGDIIAVTSKAFKNITKATTFYAMWKKNKVSANELEVKESYKEGTTYVNDFIPTLDEIKAQVKIKDGNGVLQALKPTDTVEVLDDNKQVIAQADLKDKLYEKLKEEDTTEVTRDVQINVRVTRNNVKYHVTVKIKVYKNIYEAKTEEGRPVYVPSDYVKVTVDPTTKAEKPQKYFYYVNPEAKVAIEKENPVGVGTNTFVKWASGDTEYKLDKASNKRYQFKNATVITAEYTTDVIEQTGTEKPDTVPSNFVKVTFKPTDKATDKTDKIYWVNPSKEVTFPIADPVGAGTKTFKEWKLGNDVYKPSTPKMFTDKNGTTITATYVDDVLPADASGNKPAETPDDYVKVTVKLTDMASVKDAQGAELTGEDYKKAITKIFYVNPNKKVKLPVTKPVGKEVAAAGTEKAYTWKFTEWKSNENGPRTWSENVVADGIEDKFPVETIITAQYEKVITDQGSVTADEVVAYESYKKSETEWVNNFLPKEADLKKALKVKGNALPNDATVTFLLDKDSSGTQYASLEVELYDKLKEKANANNEPTRVEKVKAQVKFKNGEVQNVDIPIKVYKNIYEAKTETKAPHYVPSDYVKVTVDPTTKAENPQKTYYYVNPAAKVVIPGSNPTGKDNYKFTKWTMKADTATGDGTDYTLTERHKFDANSTITAQYVSDVIEQKGATRPADAPTNFVSVTFKPTDKATDKADKIYWVNPDKEVTIPVEKPVGKEGYTFKEWKIGNDVYNPAVKKQFTSNTEVKATYDEANNIIPYNPNSPITRPKGYIRVKFEAEKGLELENVKYYYVKMNAKDAQGNALTLGDLKKPTVKPELGYELEKWDKLDTVQIAGTDIVVTAKATKLDKAIPEKDGNGKLNKKPEGYKEVTFVVKTGDEAKGSLSGTIKYYVNPKEYVTLTPPTPTPKTGYEFGAWSKDVNIPTIYDKDTTITASFNSAQDLIPKFKDDGTENAKPNGYHTVTFTINQVDGKDPAKFVAGEKTVYYVKPNTDVTINPPKTVAETGYKFKEWSSDTATPTKYTGDTEVKATFTPLADIIDGDQAKPDGYVTVTFVKGEKGKSITGQTVYYVNPKAGKTIGDLRKPTVKADVGYIQKTIVEGGVNKPQWDIADSTEINGTDDITVKPVYKELKNVVPQFNDDGTENAKPEGYIKVTFSTEANGKIKDTTDTTTKIVYVNPNKAVVLKGFDPEVTPNTGYEFADWDTQIDKRIQYSNNYTIKAKYNEKGNVIAQEKQDGSDKPAGYLTVTFAQGEHGTLSGKTVYYVNPNKEVTLTAPKVTPNVGWEQKTGTDAWDQALTQKFTADNTTITAQYEPIADIVAKKNYYEKDKPEGYVRVEFVKGDHGKEITGQTVYYVNPNKTVKLTAPTVKAETGWKQKDGAEAWDTALTQQFKQNAIIKAVYEERKDVIEKTKNDDSEKPAGYVTVKLIPTNKATDATKAEKTYFVNPNKEVTIKNKPEGKTEKVGEVEYTYTFRGWTVTRGVIGSWNSEEIKGMFKQDTDITAIYSKAAKTKEPPKYDPNDVIPFDPSDLDDPSNPIKRPKDYIKVTFDADPGIKLKESKAYYVKKNLKDKDGNPVKVGVLQKPTYETAQGYAFEKWDDENIAIGTADITLTAKAKKIYSECTPDTRPDYRPEYETRYKYRDRIIEKEKIVEKIVKVGSDDLLKEIRYMQGYNGKFRPYDGLTRAEAAQILANALKADGYRYNEHYALSYTDVGNAWYTDAIRVVTQAGVFTGYNDGSFKPQGKITRAEWVSTLRRFQNLRVEAGNLMNLKAGHWASGEVGAALKAGWLEIYVNGIASFDADAPITRQEVAAVSNKAFRRVLDKVYLRRSVNTLLNYKDINPSMPLYEDILCASNTLLTDGRYYKANTIVMDNVTFNIVTDLLKITQKKFQILH